MNPLLINYKNTHTHTQLPPNFLNWFQHLGIVLAPGECKFHFSYVFRYVRRKQVSQMNTCYLSHEGHPPKWKVSKIQVGENNVIKNGGCIFYCFLTWLQLFSIGAQCKENNENNHNFTLDKKYCLQEKMLPSKKCLLY